MLTEPDGGFAIAVVWGVAIAVLGMTLLARGRNRQNLAGSRRERQTEHPAVPNAENSPPKVHYMRDLAALQNYAETCGVETIVGLNRGGVLLGAAIAAALPRARFVKMFVNPLNIMHTRIDDAAGEVSGRVLVIDDICRSGTTLYVARIWLLGRFRSISSMQTAVLMKEARAGAGSTFVAPGEPGKHLVEVPTGYRMPWSGEDWANWNAAENRESEYRKLEEQDSEENYLEALRSIFRWYASEYPQYVPASDIDISNLKLVELKEIVGKIELSIVSETHLHQSKQAA